MRLGTIIAVAAAACALTACSGSDTGNGGGGGNGHHARDGAGPSTTATGSQTGGDGDAALAVTKAELTGAVDGYTPDTQGDMFLVLTATLTNESQTPPLVASYDLFSLKTVDQLVYSPTSVSAELDDACDGEVSVAAGGSKTCAIAFEVPATVSAQELDYAMPRRISLSASVPPPMQQSCDPPPVATTSCVDCLQQRCANNTQQGCQSGEVSCMENCWFEGRDLCACQSACNASDACVSALHELATCATNLCSGAGC